MENVAITFGVEKLKMVWLIDGKKFDDMFSRFDRIPLCDSVKFATLTIELLPSVILTNVAVLLTYLLHSDYESRSASRFDFLYCVRT